MRERQNSPFIGLRGPGRRMKLGHKSLATTTLWGKVREGSWTAIKAIKKRLRSLVVEGERDPLINRPEITAGYKIIKLGKMENHTGSPCPKGRRNSTSGAVSSFLRLGKGLWGGRWDSKEPLPSEQLMETPWLWGRSHSEFTANSQVPQFKEKFVIVDDDPCSQESHVITGLGRILNPPGVVSLLFTNIWDPFWEDHPFLPIESWCGGRTVFGQCDRRHSWTGAWRARNTWFVTTAKKNVPDRFHNLKPRWDKGAADRISSLNRFLKLNYCEIWDVCYAARTDYYKPYNMSLMHRAHSLAP